MRRAKVGFLLVLCFITDITDIDYTGVVDV